MHVAAQYAVSRLGAQARSPTADAVKALKHLICWLHLVKHKGICWGGGGNPSILPPSVDTLKEVLNTRGAPVPRCLYFYADSDLKERSRYMAIAMLNGAPVWARSRVQPSVATDITDSESFAYSVAAVMAEVISEASSTTWATPRPQCRARSSLATTMRP